MGLPHGTLRLTYGFATEKVKLFQIGALAPALNSRIGALAPALNSRIGALTPLGSDFAGAFHIFEFI